MLLLCPFQNGFHALKFIHEYVLLKQAEILYSLDQLFDFLGIDQILKSIFVKLQTTYISNYHNLQQTNDREKYMINSNF